MTTLSIITAVYNAERTIGHTMDSVAAQAARPFEHLVIDGLSTDRTLAIVREKSAPFTRVLSGKDDGIFDALNKGIRAASGDVVGFIHADDVYPDAAVLGRVARVFDELDVDCCYGDNEYVRAEDVGRVVRYWRAGGYRPGIFRRGWMPPHPTFYARREVYQRLGLYNTSMRVSNDYELMIRFLHKHKLSVAYIPAVLMKMRVGGNSNGSLRNIARKMLEDVQSWSINGQRGGVRAVLLKNVTKLPQFFVRRRGSHDEAEADVQVWRPRKPR